MTSLIDGSAQMGTICRKVIKTNKKWIRLLDNGVLCCYPRERMLSAKLFDLAFCFSDLFLWSSHEFTTTQPCTITISFLFLFPFSSSLLAFKSALLSMPSPSPSHFRFFNAVFTWMFFDVFYGGESRCIVFRSIALYSFTKTCPSVITDHW